MVFVAVGGEERESALMRLEYDRNEFLSSKEGRALYAEQAE